jgi:hypothetical protein
LKPPALPGRNGKDVGWERERERERDGFFAKLLTSAVGSLQNRWLLLTVGSGARMVMAS